MEKNEKKKRKSLLEKEEMVQLYSQGLSTAEIGKLANVSARYVRMVLKEYNAEMRPRGSWKRKYEVNENYFKVWSDEMAYILGFFIADGSVTDNVPSIGFSQKEKYILEDIKREMNSNHPIIKNEKTDVYTLNLNSKILKEDMINIHGIHPRKSYDVIFPNVPNEYMYHFIRGYFDGDGYVNHERRVVSFVGSSISFMNSLEQILKNKGFQPRIVEKNKHFRLIISGRRSIRLFADLIYTDKNLYIKRKFDIFEQENLKLNELSDRSLKMTKAAVIERKNKFLIEYKIHGCVDMACKAIGVQKNTFLKWTKDDMEFNKRLDEVFES
ncbi:endonuclease [Bacillus aerolatus]|uniref:Endonuclease n=1 Tax=Bacillus aerolatus TaxID=2653354 RepID=A0A6I1FEI5_9BACI|nr:LAGLIDADG family homing endonuclease [Bacillus aerolatus]KAB7706185.1 endonuclease [Bacillus aerolatus]